MEITSIYTLSSNGIPVYVGKTIDVKQSTIQHKAKFPNDKLEVIDEVPTTEWEFWERHWILQMKAWGFVLRNKTEGGGGLTKHCAETKNKIRLLLTGKKQSAETKAKRAKHLIGNKYTLGHKLSQEHKDKISAGLKLADTGKGMRGKKHSAAIIAKMVESRSGEKSHSYGTHPSEKTRKIWSEQRKGRIPWNKGLKGLQIPTEETKIKMRIAQQKRVTTI